MKRIVNNMTIREKTGVIALIFTIISTILILCFDPFNWFYNREIYRNELGGSMNATYQTRLLNNGETKTIVVCVEDNDISLNELPITPTFENPYKYSLKDFSLSFEAECTNVSLTPSSFFDEHKRGENKWLFSYSKGVLASFNEIQSPFSCIQLNGSKGHCFIKSKASYNGIHSAFEYYTDVLFFVVPMCEGKSYLDWKKDCEERFRGSIKDGLFDIFYCTKKNQIDYQFDLDVGFMCQPIDPTETEKNNEGISQDNYEFFVPVVANTIDSTIEISKKHHELVGCVVKRTDSLLKYEMTLNPNDCETGLYMLEGRHKQDPNKTGNMEYEYYELYIGRQHRTAEYSIVYRGRKAPEIDQVSLFPQCVTEDVISLKQKDNKYIIKNETEYTVVCFFHYSDKRGTHFALDGGCERILDNIGVLPIEVFNTNRKTNLERNDSRFSLGLIFSIGIALLSLFFFPILLVNVYLFVKSFFSKKNLFDLREAIGETMFSNLYQGYKNYESKRSFIDELIALGATLFSPVGCYFIFKMLCLA